MNYAGRQQQQQPQHHHNHIDSDATVTDVINNCNPSSGIDDLSNYYYLGNDQSSLLSGTTRLNTNTSSHHQHLYPHQPPLASSSSPSTPIPAPLSYSRHGTHEAQEYYSKPPDIFLKLYRDNSDEFDSSREYQQVHQNSTTSENPIKPDNAIMPDDMFNFAPNDSRSGFECDSSARQHQCLSPGSAAAAWLAQDEAIKMRQLDHSDTPQLATTKNTGSTNSANGSTSFEEYPALDMDISEQQRQHLSYLYDDAAAVKPECTLSSLLSQHQSPRMAEGANMIRAETGPAQAQGQDDGGNNNIYPPLPLSAPSVACEYPQSSPPSSLQDLISMIGLPQSNQQPPSSSPRLQQRQPSPSSGFACPMSPSFNREDEFAYTYPQFPNTGDFAHKIQYKRNGNNEQTVESDNQIGFDHDGCPCHNNNTCLETLQDGISYDRQSTTNNHGILLPPLLLPPPKDGSSPLESGGSAGNFNESLRQIFNAVNAGESAGNGPGLGPADTLSTEDLCSLGEFTTMNGPHADMDMSAAGMLDEATISSSHSPEIIGGEIHSGESASGGSSGGGGSIRSTRSCGRIIKTGTSGSMACKKRKSPSSKNSTGKGTTTILPAPSFVNESGSSKGSFGLMNFRRPGAWTRRPSGSVKKPFVYYDKEEDDM